MLQDNAVVLPGVLAGTAFLLAIVAGWWGLRPWWRAASFHNPDMPEHYADPDQPDETSADAAGKSALPKVSVVMYCQSDVETLMSALQAISTQDYPNRETIVVCDAGVEYAAGIQEMVAEQFNDVYVTFVQPGSHNLSRRKLANTIGIKAASGDVVLTTVANIEVPSSRWLSMMMAPFCGPQGKYTDIAVGVSMIDFDDLHGPGKWFRQFDTVLADGLWIGYAANGHPFRGDALNLAFRKSFFFDNKGYALTNHLHNGDDDILLKALATPANCKVVAGPDCILRTRWGESANRIWAMRKSTYAFTARWLPRAPFCRNGFMSLTQWLLPALALACALTSLHSLWLPIAALVILLAFWSVEIACYRRLASRLAAVRLWWAVIPFWLLRPISNFFFNLRQKGTRKKNYTWQR